MDTAEGYFGQIAKFPLLTAKEERDLGKRIAKGCQASFEKMVCSNLRLVIAPAKKHCFNDSNHSRFMDFVMAGNLGLMKAAKKFLPSKGCRFSTYAMWWIRQSIEIYDIDTRRTIKLPSNMHYALGQARRLVNDNPHSPSALAKLERLEKCIPKADSFDWAENPDGAMHAGVQQDYLADASPAPWQSSDAGSLREHMLDCLAELPQRERLILMERFGFGEDGVEDDEPRTLAEIGERHKITRERIRQIQEKALERMRQIHRMKDLGMPKNFYEANLRAQKSQTKLLA